MPTGTPPATGPSWSRPGPVAPAPEGLIDLGGDRDPVTEAAPGPRMGRRLKAALIVALTFVALSAAAPPERGITEVAALGRGSAAAIALSPAAAFVATFTSTTRSTVRRYALSGDRASEDWSVDLRQTVDWLQVDDAADVVLAFYHAGQGSTALDARTGDVLWSEQGADVIQIVDGRVLLLHGDLGRPARLRMVNLRTGGAVWTRDFDPGTWQLDAGSGPAQQPRNLVAVGKDGRVDTYGLADGRLVASANLGFRLRPSERNFRRDFIKVSVVGQTLYVARRSAGRTSLAAYPVATLSLQWHIAGGPVGALNSCRPYLCVSDDIAVSALEPTTGRPLWTDPRWSFVQEELGGWMVASDKSAEPQSSLIDPATGRPLRRLGPGSPRGGPSLTFLRISGRDQAVQVLSIEPGTGAVRVVGEIGAVTPYRCTSAGSYLACPTIGGSTRVWHLPG